jgi:D-glycero-alpha-D-manno-heptose 1-phosphate guanylyltransferase
MAPVNGRPFLAHLLDALISARFDSAILAVGYKSEQIHEHFGERYRSLPLRYSVESQPLGTGGALKLAMEHVDTTTVFVLNSTESGAMHAAHDEASRDGRRARCPDASHGALDIAGARIRGFRKAPGAGSINAGAISCEHCEPTHSRLPSR